jgi:hypothetical protein
MPRSPDLHGNVPDTCLVALLLASSEVDLPAFLRGARRPAA